MPSTWLTGEHGAWTQGQRQDAQRSHGDGVSGSFPQSLAHSIPGIGAEPQEGRFRPTPTLAWDIGTSRETGKDRSQDRSLPFPQGTAGGGMGTAGHGPLCGGQQRQSGPKC